MGTKVLSRQSGTFEKVSATMISFVKQRTKETLRRLIPAHLRLIRTAYYFEHYGEREVRLLPQLIKPDTVAIDVGSHLGDYTYILCKHLGKKGRVIAIEPVADLAHQLEIAARRLRLPVTVHHCALSSKSGQADLLIPTDKTLLAFATLEPRAAGSGKSFRVPMRTLDDICRDVDAPISFVKIDVEGHEMEVLRGGVETLKKHRPTLLIEIEQRHSSIPISQTFDFVLAQNYRGEFLDRDGHFTPLSNFDPQKHQVDGPVKSPDYVFNFIFRPV
jgi:FkbM family methyltransferase